MQIGNQEDRHGLRGHPPYPPVFGDGNASSFPLRREHYPRRGLALTILHYAARILGVSFKVDGLPYGAKPKSLSYAEERAQSPS